MSYEFRMTSRVNAERIDVFMSGRSAAFVNVSRSEINPRTEISIENTSTGMFLKLFCRHVWMFSYLLSLNNFDFWKFVSWQIVSSNTNIFNSSQITMSGRTHDWNATSIGSKFAEGRSTRRRWLLICAFVSTPQSWLGFLLCRSEYRFSAAEQFDRTCLFVCGIDFRQSAQLGSSILFHRFKLYAVGSCCWNAFRTKRNKVVWEWLQRSWPLLYARSWNILRHAPSQLTLTNQRPDMYFGFGVKIVLEFPSCLSKFNVFEQSCVCIYIVISCVWPYLSNFRLSAVLQCRSFHKNHFSVQISDWRDAQPSSVLGQRWEFFYATAHRHPEPFTYVLCTHRIQMLNYPRLTERVQL